MFVVGILFFVFFVLIGIGVPIAFAIALASVATAFYTGVPIAVIFQRLISGIDSFPVLAVPLFILAGAIMDRGGVSKKIFGFISCLVGHLRGGLAMATALAGALFGFVTGSGVADIAAIGSITLPELVRRGYTKGFAASLQACTGILGGIIPPSVVLVVLGVSGHLSIGALFLGAILPCFVFVFLLMATTYLICRIKKYGGTGERANWSETLLAGKDSILPLLTPVIVLGGIYSGMFTPTEAAGVTVLYSMFLGLVVYRTIKPKEIISIGINAVSVSTSIVIIMGTGAMFSWIMAAHGGPELIKNSMLSLSQNKYIIMFFIMGIGILAGMVMEGLAIIIIFTPVFLPLAQSLGFDPIHFGIAWALNNGIGAITPPVGLGLMTACRIIQCPYPPPLWDILPLVLTMFFGLGIIIAFPQLTLWLSRLI